METRAIDKWGRMNEIEIGTHPCPLSHVECTNSNPSLRGYQILFRTVGPMQGLDKRLSIAFADTAPTRVMRFKVLVSEKYI